MPFTASSGLLKNNCGGPVPNLPNTEIRGEAPSEPCLVCYISLFCGLLAFELSSRFFTSGRGYWFLLASVHGGTRIPIFRPQSVGSQSRLRFSGPQGLSLVGENK